MLFEKIAIIGVGLIGAAFALAAKKHGISKIIAGYGRNEDNLKRARLKDIIDDYSPTLKDLCKDANLVVLASPVGTFLELSRSFSSYLHKGAIVTDVGSVKGSLVYDLEATMPEGIHFVGAHPIAGNDRSGIDAANDSLFEGAKCIITPTENTDKVSLSTVSEIWERFGSRTITLSPERHDIIFSTISHLPHIVAYALVNTVEDVNREFFAYGGSGFLDTTRIAMSSPEIWRDICILNKENILSHINTFKNKLNELSGFLYSMDKDSLHREFACARSLRKGLINNNNEYNKTKKSDST